MARKNGLSRGARKPHPPDVSVDSAALPMGAAGTSAGGITLALDDEESATSFFRDPEAYAALASQVFPRLTEDRGPDDPVRVWSLGCSTGEEAYSIAIAYAEFCEASGRSVPLQVFATDVNAAALDKARAGLYPRTIAREVSPERLARFFAEADGNYRICASIRDQCVFARHNALSDSPFSRIDLVACRNFLIYLEPALQQRIIPLLHLALRPDGYLWLGGSETIGSYRELLELVDAKGEIYTGKPSNRTPELASPLAIGRRRSAVATPPVPPAPSREPSRQDPMREADPVLLARHAPSARDESSPQEIARLKQEISATRDYLQSVIEQQEAANDDLQSANEALRIANEELQSIHEQLETSKEEIQSVDEQLATVTDELHNRKLELSKANDDLANLLATVNVAIVMLGPDLRIRRFTQHAGKILNLAHADLGRPLFDMNLSIDAPDLEPLVLDVIENVTVREREVQDRNGRWYSLRVRPYRTFENKIEGAVVMLVDVDKLQRA
jgi:two-component system CheB/CheR fusion protein